MCNLNVKLPPGFIQQAISNDVTLGKFADSDNLFDANMQVVQISAYQRVGEGQNSFTAEKVFEMAKIFEIRVCDSFSFLATSRIAHLL